jgi:hypothetical protein
MQNMYMQRSITIDNKMQCMQINKYEHVHDGGSKKEN